MKLNYRPKGVCSQLMEIEVENGKVISVNITGGCAGNTKGVSRLVEGMSVDEVIERLEGIRCGFKQTSCPDQLAKALRQMRDENA